MRAVEPRVTFAELQQWPEDNRRYELYDGQVIVVPSPFPRHQRVLAHIGDVLREYEQQEGGLTFLAPLDIVLSEYDVVQPDVVFFRRERCHLIQMMQPTHVAPDLVVEVLSRSTEVRDRGRKLALFAQFDVPEYWIVDPVANILEIYTTSGKVYECAGSYDGHHDVTSPTLSGLQFPASRIFAE